MGVIIPPESELGKELERWNTPKRLGGEAPNGKEEYPKMLYMAHRYSNGKVICGHIAAATGVDDPEAVAFNNKCQHTVYNGEQHAQMLNAGWCESPDEAIERFEAQEKAVADAAANAQFHARRMSPKALEEFERAQDAADFHDPDPAAPPLPPTPSFSKTEAEFRAEIEAELRAKIEAEMAEKAASKKKKNTERGKKAASKE